MSMFETEKPDMFGRNIHPDVMVILQTGSDRLTIQWMKFRSLMDRAIASRKREQALIQRRISKLESYIELQKRTKKSERNNEEVIRARQSIGTLKSWL
jgi:hypothetical protein